MADTVAPAPSSSRATYACIRCADRKVKCDRQRPCGACVKHDVACVFNPSPPPRKRRKRAIDHQLMAERIRHYEALLHEQGIDPAKPLDSPSSSTTSHYTTRPVRAATTSTASATTKEAQTETPSSLASEPTGCVNKTQVVHSQGRSQFVENSLWTRVVEEFPDPDDALDDSSNEASDPEASDDDFGYVLDRPSKAHARCRHPRAERIHQLWEIFIANIDPLTKIVHVPTLRPAIQKAASNVAIIPRGFEALMFAIYSTAVMSLTDDDCRAQFGEPQKVLLSRYITATKAALLRAKFMGASSLVVLQALVLHLLSVRDIYEPRAIWSLTGVAVRIAQAMGLERDGSVLGMAPFEVEIRRRVWWLLKTHDFRTAELCGLAKFRDLDLGPDNTKFPLNINDDQIYPGMTAPPAEVKGLTDIAFLSLRYELAGFAVERVAQFRKQELDPSKWDLSAAGKDRAEIDVAFREIEELLETKYLRYCDPCQPLHLMIMLMARAAMNVIRFLTHHPRRWASLEQTPLSERRWVWDISVKLLEQHNMLQSNPQLKQYAWHAAYILQWHAFIHVLDSLRAEPLMPDAQKTWHLVECTYANNPVMIDDTKKPIHIAVGNLCLKAFGAREAALQTAGTAAPPTPPFIRHLRQQREAARLKRQARDAKATRTADAVPPGPAGAGDLAPRPVAAAPLSAPVSSAPLSQETPYLSTTPDPGSLLAETDPFWYINGLDDNQFGNLPGTHMLSIDADFAHELEPADSTTQQIDWEQWDVWLAESNAVGPYFINPAFQGG